MTVVPFLDTLSMKQRIFTKKKSSSSITPPFLYIFKAVPHTMELRYSERRTPMSITYVAFLRCTNGVVSTPTNKMKKKEIRTMSPGLVNNLNSMYDITP